MELLRDLGASKFTWTDVVTGVTGTRADYSRSAYTTAVSYSDTEVAWKDGTITLAQSSANTGTSDVIVIGYDTNKVLYASINGTLTYLASGA